MDELKVRYRIRQLHICGGKLSGDALGVVVCKTEFEDFVEQYTKRAECPKSPMRYKKDETGLSYKMLPQEPPASKEERSAPGHKTNKRRITVLICSSASGTTHRLPLLCTEKYSKGS